MEYKTSKGEQKIIDILNQNRIYFEREKSFPGLKGKKNTLLRFDFVVYQNGKVFACIEFDGKQHYEFTPYFHKTRKNFLRQQEWDRRKNSYCIMNNIPLIRIPYWDLDILTFQRIFTEPSYRVKSKNHIDNQIWRMKR